MPQCGDDRADHVAAGGDDDDLDLTIAVLAGPVPDHLPVEHGLLERHRDVVLGLKADRVGELAGILDRRQREGADGDSLVGDAEPHGARELVLGEELLERVAEGLGVGDLALVEDPRLEGLDAVAHDLDGAVDSHLGRGNASGLDIEADD